MALEAETETQALPVVGVPPRDAATWRNDLLIASSLGLLMFALYVLPAVLWRPLFDPAEVRVAVAAREMVRSGNYALPTIGGAPWTAQPPLSCWLAALTAKVIGGGDASEHVMTRAVEIPSALLAAFSVFLLALYGGTIGGRAAGILAGLILGVGFIVARYAQLGSPDAALMAASAAAFCSAAWLLCVPHAGALAAFAFGASLGLGVLAGGVMPLLCLAAPLLLEIAIRHRFSFRKAMLFGMGLAVAACVAAPWFFIVESRHPGALNEFAAYARDMLTPKVNEDSPLFLIYKLAAGMLPWTPLLLVAWPIYLFKKRAPEEVAANPHPIINEHLRFLMLAGICAVIVLSVLDSKHAHFLVALLPPVALASGVMLSRLKSPGGMAEERLAWLQFYAGIMLGLAVAAIPLVAPALTGRADRISENIVKLNGKIGWSLISVGIVVILASCYCARQWAEGRTLHAGLLIAAAGFAGLMGYSFDWTTNTQKSPIAHESARLRQEAAAHPYTQFFAATNESEATDAKLTFYLDRPVLTVRKQLSGPNAPPPPRALLATPEQLKVFRLQASAPPGQQFVMVPNVSEEDWEEIIKSVSVERKQ